MKLLKQQISDLRDYTDTTAAIHLLEQALDHDGVISIPAANKIIKKENLNEPVTIGNVIKQILAQSGAEEDSCRWIKEANGRCHREVVITMGGAVYQVDIDAKKYNEYSVKIKAQLNQKNTKRGKLFFNHNHEATIALKVDNQGEIHAITKKGLDIHSKAFMLRPAGNEVVKKYISSLENGEQQRLAVLATGSGKSIIMASIGQAIGPTVMVVPDKALVRQQVDEVTAMLSAGVTHGKQTKPSIFTFEQLKTHLKINWKNDPECKNPENIKQVKAVFSKVLAGEIAYDQVILEAENPFFKVVSNEIKDQMVLIDESHQHTYTEESLSILSTINKQNSVLALTATPTSKLYALYGDPLDDFSLGAAIELGTVRPIKPEVAYLEENDLINQAITHYFNDYYLTEENNGYVSPHSLIKQLRIEHPNYKEAQIRELAIDKAIDLNRIRTQRNMAFSDDEPTRSALQSIYKKIASGDQETIKKFENNVSTLRVESETHARLQMESSLNNSLGKTTPTRQRAEIKAKVTEKTQVNLKQDILFGQQKDIQRSINSYAMALVFGDKTAVIAEKDRTHKLTALLDYYDQEISKTETADSKLAEKINKCKKMTPENLQESLLNMNSPINQLPEHQKQIIVDHVVKKAYQMANHIKNKQPISKIIQTNSIDEKTLKALNAEESYCSSIDLKTKQTNPTNIERQLAQMEIGLKTHIIGDQSIATGVSDKNILNVQIINQYTEVVESDPNVINGPISGPQAAGRCIRNPDSLARVQQYIDQRYESKDLIVSIDDIIDPVNSANKIKKIIQHRDAVLTQQTEISEKTHQIEKPSIDHHEPEIPALSNDTTPFLGGIPPDYIFPKDIHSPMLSGESSIFNPFAWGAIAAGAFLAFTLMYKKIKASNKLPLLKSKIKNHTDTSSTIKNESASNEDNESSTKPETDAPETFEEQIKENIIGEESTGPKTHAPEKLGEQNITVQESNDIITYPNKTEFNACLEKIKSKLANLEKKSTKSSSKAKYYVDVAATVRTMLNDLDEAGKKFFDVNEPLTPARVNEFKQTCESTLSPESKYYESINDVRRRGKIITFFLKHFASWFSKFNKKTETAQIVDTTHTILSNKFKIFKEINRENSSSNESQSTSKDKHHP